MQAKKVNSDPVPKLAPLDGLRGFAVLIVIVSHSALRGFEFVPGVDLTGIGKSGVFLFFALSAFLLMRNFASTDFAATSLRHYAIRRIFRIIPLYYLFITVGFISTQVASLAGLKSGILVNLNAKEYLLAVLMVGVKGVAWSIPVEFQFYFLLPVLAWIFVVIFRSNLFLSGILAVALSLLAGLIWTVDGWEQHRTLGHHLSIFLFGSLAGLSSLKFGRCLDGRIAIFNTIGFIALSMFVILIPSVWQSIAPAGWEFRPQKQFLLFAVLWSVIVWLSVCGSTMLEIIFSIGFLRFLGKISYSAYLLHGVAIGLAVAFKFSPFIGSLFILGVTMLLGWLSYRFVEQPLAGASYREGRLRFA